MIISSPTDPKIETLGIREIAQKSITWFDKAREIEELAETKFTFILYRCFDKREHVKSVKGDKIHVYKWHREAINTFLIYRSVGHAYDKRINDLGMRSILEMLPNFPRRPTASCPINQIITVDELTRDIFQAITQLTPHEVERIKLKVELFALNGNQLATKKWTFDGKRSVEM